MRSSDSLTSAWAVLFQAGADPAALLSDELWAAFEDRLRAALTELYMDVLPLALDYAAEDLWLDYGLGVDTLDLSGPAAAWARANTDAMVEIITNSQRAGVGEAIAAWSRSGEHLEALLRRLEMLHITNARITGITEATRAQSAGVRFVWESSGAVSARRWATAVDERVCPICRPLNGTVIALDQPFRRVDARAQGQLVGSIARYGVELNPYGDPPAHPRCRCRALPVVLMADVGRVFGFSLPARSRRAA